MSERRKNSPIEKVRAKAKARAIAKAWVEKRREQDNYRRIFTTDTTNHIPSLEWEVFL